MAVHRFLALSEGGSPRTDEKKRLAAWDEQFRVSGARDILFHDDRPLTAWIESVPLGAVGVGRAGGNLYRIERHRHHAGRNDGGPFSLVINRGAGATIAEGHRGQTSIPPWGAMFFDPARPSIHTYPGDHASVALNIPRHLLHGTLRQGEDLHLKLIPARNEAVRLLGAFVDSVIASQLSDGTMTAEYAAQTLIDLAILGLGADRDSGEVARLRGLRAARLDEVLRCIRARYRDATLTPKKVARRVGISSRYLHELLQEAGTSWSERLQELRLAKAWALLAGDSSGNLKIIDTAFSAGFGDVSHFNHLFRRRYGMTPSAARGTAPSRPA